jgi:hypothetical protein
MTCTMEEILGKPVYVYTRAQAIEDGVLIDVSATAREAGIKFPVAMTAEVWSENVAWTDEDSKRKGGLPQDEAGRLWDVIWMLKVAIRVQARRHNGANEELKYQFYCVPRDGKGRKARLVTVKAVCGPNDDASPCITIMNLNQD